MLHRIILDIKVRDCNSNIQKLLNYICQIYPKNMVLFQFLALLLTLDQKHWYYSNLRARISRKRAIACINATSGSFNFVIKNFLKKTKMAA